MAAEASLAPLEAAERVLVRLRELGHLAYLAGGCVRDHLLGWNPQDFDVATSATPDEVEGAFRRTIAVGKQFGVINVLIGGRNIEVATFRQDGSYADGRRPDSITYSGPEEDVKRRDFTINGLLWDPAKSEVLDFVGGREDLKRRVVRAIGDPNARLSEDALRLLRAVRFGSLGDLTLDSATKDAVTAHAARIDHVSAERIRDELKKIATHRRSRRGDAWRLLVESGLAERVLPEIPRASADLVAARLDALPVHALAPFLAVGLLTALKQGAPPREGFELGARVIKRLRGSKEESNALSALLADHHRYLSGKKHLSRCRLAACREDHALHEALLIAVGRTDVVDQLHATRAHHGSTLPLPLVDGRVLMAHGVPPGRTLGRTLRRVRVGQLEGLVADQDAALLWARERQGS